MLTNNRKKVQLNGTSYEYAWCKHYYKFLSPREIEIHGCNQKKNGNCNYLLLKAEYVKPLQAVKRSKYMNKY